MLATHCLNVTSDFSVAPDQLPMLVQLPPEMSNFFVESGYLETVLRGTARSVATARALPSHTAERFCAAVYQTREAFGQSAH